MKNTGTGPHKLEKAKKGEGVRISKFWDGSKQPPSWDLSIGMLYEKFDRANHEILSDILPGVSCPHQWLTLRLTIEG